MVRTACVELSEILTKVVAGIEVASTAGADVDVVETAVIVGGGGSDVVGGIAAVRGSTVIATVGLRAGPDGAGRRAERDPVEQAPTPTSIIISALTMMRDELSLPSRSDLRRSNTPGRLYRRPDDPVSAIRLRGGGLDVRLLER